MAAAINPKKTKVTISRAMLAFCILASAVRSSTSVESEPSLTKHNGRNKLTQTQIDALAQSGLSVNFEYKATVDSAEYRGLVYTREGQQYIYPEHDFYTADLVSKLEITEKLEGIGEKHVESARHAVVFGKLNKDLRRVRLKFSACNCAYPLIFFHGDGDLSFEFVQEQDAHMARVVSGGDAPARVLRSEIDFELGKWAILDNPNQANRFLYFCCVFYDEQSPQFELVVDIDTQEYQFPQVSAEQPPDTQAEQAEEVVEHFEQDQNKDDKIVIEDVKKDDRGQDIEPVVQDDDSQQDAQKEVIVNEVTAPMGRLIWGWPSPGSAPA